MIVMWSINVECDLSNNLFFFFNEVLFSFIKDVHSDGLAFFHLCSGSIFLKLHNVSIALTESRGWNFFGCV